MISAGVGLYQYGMVAIFKAGAAGWFLEDD